MHRLGILASSLFFFSLSTAAQAGFGEKTMRAPMPAHSVDRGLILPRGWFEVELGASQKTSTSSWDSSGQRVAWDHSKWLYKTENLKMTLGMGHRSNLWFEVPWHQARLDHVATAGVGGDSDWSIKDASVGDTRFGWTVVLTDDEESGTTAAFESWYKGPTAAESPGTFIGGPLNVQQFVFTTGTPDMYLGFAAKVRGGPVAATARVGYVRRFSSNVQYLIELDNTQFAGRIQPGDQLRFELNGQAQAGPIELHASVDGLLRGQVRVGTSSGGVAPNRQLYALEGSDGAQMDLAFGAVVNANRAVDLGVDMRLPVMGEDLMFFPIEDLHPTAGTTVGAHVEVRY